MEEITFGITREYFGNGNVVSYRVSSVSLGSINAWSNAAITSLNNWSAHHPYLAIHDISQPGIGFLFLAAVENDVFNIGVTSSAQKHVQEIIESRPDWRLALAIVISPSLSGRVTMLLHQQNQQELRIKSKAFFHHSAALRWLRDFTVSAGASYSSADIRDGKYKMQSSKPY